MIDWVECSPRQAGFDIDGLIRVMDTVRARGATAQLCVLRDGQVVLDRAIGCEPRSLFWIFSAGKPFTALLVHLLAERGDLALDERLAAYWPEFGRHGKDAITTRQVLQHRSGLPVARSMLRDALVMADWERSVAALERARPRWPPGRVPAYHVISQGFILGELVRRVTGTSVRDVLRTEFLEPLGLEDTHLGLPGHLWSRHVPVRGHGGAGRVAQAFINRRSTRQAVIPAAGVSTTARDLARFYQALLCDGELDGVRILRTATVEQARRPSSNGELDRFLGVPIRWAHGFQLGGPAPAPTEIRPMGRLSGPETFGHNGSNACIAWADPVRRLVVVYLTDVLSPGPAGARHMGAVSDAIIGACLPNRYR